MLGDRCEPHPRRFAEQSLVASPHSLLDHDDPDEAEAMEAKERVLLARHHRGEGGNPA